VTEWAKSALAEAEIAEIDLAATQSISKS
jgi:hypothetical protein